MLKQMFLCLLAACFILVSQPRSAEAAPLFLFAFTAIAGGAAAVTYEECREEGIDLKECASKAWREREPLNYSNLND